MRRIFPWLVAAVSVLLIAGVVSFWTLGEDEQRRLPPRSSDSAPAVVTAPSVYPPAATAASATASAGASDTLSRLAEIERNIVELNRLRAHDAARVAQGPASSISNQSAPQRPAESLQSGKIAWNTPPAMTLGQTSEVELRITLDLERFKGLEQRIRAPGATTSEEAELAPDLSAKLESIAFDIKPDGAQRQRVREGRDAVWSWVISPKLKGEHKLLLTITSDAENRPSIEPLVRTIRVTAAPGEALDEAAAFVSRNWDKLLTLIIIPVAVWGWQTYKKRRTQSLPPLPPAPPGT